MLDCQGRCAPDLLFAIPAIAGWRRSSLPSYLSAEEIERVIDACDCTTAIGAVIGPCCYCLHGWGCEPATWRSAVERH